MFGLGFCKLFPIHYYVLQLHTTIEKNLSRAERKLLLKLNQKVKKRIIYNEIQNSLHSYQ